MRDRDRVWVQIMNRNDPWSALSTGFPVHIDADLLIGILSNHSNVSFVNYNGLLADNISPVSIKTQHI